jgi:hypothetical protein
MKELRARIAPMARLCAIAAVAIALAGCSLSGRVYIAFFWSDSEAPDAGFACSAPNVPASAAAVARGKYYETIPGAYTLDYSYLSGESHSLSFALEADGATLGQENAYYHANLRKAAGPTVESYP